MDQPPASLFELLSSNTSQPSQSVEPIEQAVLDGSEDLVAHTAVYVIADEKRILALKEPAKKKYEAALESSWNSEAFCRSLKMVREETDEDDKLLRPLAIEFAGRKAKELMDRGEFVEVCKNNSGIAFALFKTFVDANPEHLKPVYLIPAGCPDYGAAHAPNVVQGRRGLKFFCYFCSKGFN